MRGKKKNGFYKSLKADEAEIGLLSGVGSNSTMKSYKYGGSGGALTCISSAIKDKKLGGCSIIPYKCAVGQNEGEYPTSYSLSSSTSKFKRNDRRDIKSLSCIDFMKIDDDFNNSTLETWNGSLSMTSNPVMSTSTTATSDIQRKEIIGDDNDSTMRCLQKLVQMKKWNDDDISLNPIPARRLKSMLAEHENSMNKNKPTRGPHLLKNRTFSFGSFVGATKASASSSKPFQPFLQDGIEVRDDSDQENHHQNQNQNQQQHLRRQKPKITSRGEKQNKESSNTLDDLMNQLIIPSVSSASSSTTTSSASSSTSSFELHPPSSSKPQAPTRMIMSPSNNQGQTSLGDATYSFSFEELNEDANIEEVNENFNERKRQTAAAMAVSSATYDNDDEKTCTSKTTTTTQGTKRKIKWWDDDRSVISRVASSVYGENSICSQKSNTSQKSLQFLWKDIFQGLSIIVNFVTCDFFADEDDDEDDEDDDDDDEYANIEIDILSNTDDHVSNMESSCGDTTVDDEFIMKQKDEVNVAVVDDRNDNNNIGGDDGNFLNRMLNDNEGDNCDDNDDDDTVDLSNGIDGVAFAATNSSEC